jgi:hypothetical protein
MPGLPGGFGSAAQQALIPEDPFLFYRSGHDWRWVSFGAAAARRAARNGPPRGWEIDPVDTVLALLASGADQVLPPLQGLAPSRDRDILVLDRPPSGAEGLALLAWAAATGTALVLEVEPGRGPLTVAWARPTLVAGSTADLGELGTALLGWGDAARLRRPRAPLGRLRAIVRFDVDGELSPPWSEIDVGVVQPD